MLNKKNKAVLFNPLSKDNPVLVQILGICSSLAVTAKQVVAVDAFCGIRNLLPNAHHTHSEAIGL